MTEAPGQGGNAADEPDRQRPVTDDKPTGQAPAGRSSRAAATGATAPVPTAASNGAATTGATAPVPTAASNGTAAIPPSYGSSSFGPGPAAPALPAADPQPAHGPGMSAASAVGTAAPASNSEVTGAGPVAGDVDDGARNWREQWRAARSDDTAPPPPPGLAPAPNAGAADTASPAAAPGSQDTSRRSGGFRQALSSGLAQAKAVAAGSWTVPPKDDSSASTLIPGMESEVTATEPSTATVALTKPGSSGSTVGRQLGAFLSKNSSGAGGSSAAVGAAPGHGTGVSGAAVGGSAMAGAAVVGAAAGASAARSTGRSEAETSVTPRRGAPAQGPPRPSSAGPGAGTAVPRPPQRGAAPQPPRGRAPGRVRRAHLKLTRIDPWTIMKVSFMLAIAFGIMTIVAVAVVWSMLDAAGVFTSLNDTVESVTGKGGGALGFDLMSWVALNRVLGFATLIAVMDVVLITALSTLAAFLYNLAASLLGGVEVTFVEDHS